MAGERCGEGVSGGDKGCPQHLVEQGISAVHGAFLDRQQQEAAGGQEAQRADLHSDLACEAGVQAHLPGQGKILFQDCVSGQQARFGHDRLCAVQLKVVR